MISTELTPLPTTRQVRFPIIESLAVDGYLLYPGKGSQSGLAHKFSGGVNVIVGINGIGKTTLLLMLYRMLAGDQDLRGNENEELGDTRRVLTKINAALFAARVPDRAANATATLKFRLGGRSITIKRSLKNLTILELTATPEQPALSNFDDIDARYKEWIKQLASIDDFYDWIILLKYLIFYLEDRRSLVWDVSAQTEIFRILFMPAHSDANYKNLFNTALSADSTARNTQSVLTRESARFERLKDEALNGVGDDLPLLRGQVKGLLKKVDELSDAMVAADKLRRELRDQGARLRSDAEGLRQQERKLREHLLSQLFPSLSDTGALALAMINAEHGCIICGSTDEKQLAIARKKLETDLHCPLCDANPNQQEKRISGEQAAGGHAELHSIVEREQAVQGQARAIAMQEEASVEDYLRIQGERYRSESELKISQDRLVAAEIRGGLTENLALQQFETRLKGFKDTISDANEEKNIALQNLGVLIKEISYKVTEFKGQLIGNFENNIKSFLAEKCQLTYRTAPRNVGQNVSSVPLLFPEFHVAMTSGVFRETGTPRDDTASVSESQKEFIELAFRMSVLSAVAGNESCSLVIETPEANLDAVFIPRAGRALNEFASRPSISDSNVITSSNLNGSQMIPALLGLLGSSETNASDQQRVSDASGHVLNLLDYAAKSAALREFESEYAAKLTVALSVS